jgi:membrane-associated phospholipid phosphatase
VSKRASANDRAPRWWVELPLAAAFYYVYARIRDLHGDATEHSRTLAQSHGFAILHAEKFLHVDIERGVQSVVLHARPLVVALDVFYGTAHLLLTCAVYLWLLLRCPPPQFRHGRNVLALGTAIALVVFALYPAMPPRLMPAGVKTIDTTATVGGLWSYNNGVIEHIADPYAAMPSLHIVWSSWVAYVVWSSRPPASRWKYLVWLYPVFTGFAIISTGVHWVLDLAGGAAVFTVSVLLVRWVETLRR